MKRYARYEMIRAGLEGAAVAARTPAGEWAAGRGAIFTLHHVEPAPASRSGPNSWLTVTPAFLEQAIEAALEHGLVPIALDALPERLADPNDQRRYVCFTLDDGYRDNAEHAAPVFRRFNIPYTIFITAGFVERTRSIWWKTAEELVAHAGALDLSFTGIAETVRTRQRLEKISAFDHLSRYVAEAENEDDAVAELDRLARHHGIEPLDITARATMDADELRALAADPLAGFGAHTLTHASLTRVDAARLMNEMTGSADAVETYVGRRPVSFAYPYGNPASVGDREVQAANRAGFAVAVTTSPGLLCERARDRPTAMPRISLNGFYQKKRYVRALLSGLPFMLHGSPARRSA